MQWAVVMRAHGLTGVASEYPAAHGAPQRFRNGPSMLDIEVRDAAIRVDHAGLKERFGRAGIEALCAGAAVALEPISEGGVIGQFALDEDHR